MKDVFVSNLPPQQGGTLGVIGRQINQLKVKDFQPTLSADRKILNGQVIYMITSRMSLVTLLKKFQRVFCRFII